jgi:hypothetical protein
MDRHRERPVSASRIPYEEVVYDYDRENEPRRSRQGFKEGFKDPRVEVRGFGIVAPRRDPSVGYDPPPPKEGPRSVSAIYGTDPRLSQPNVRDFIPRPAEVERKDRDRERDRRDYDRDYPRRERDSDLHRDRDRDRDYRDSDRLRHATNATVAAAGAGVVAYAAAVGVEKKRERDRERAHRDKDADRTVDVEYDVRPERERERDREKRRTDRDRSGDHERLPAPEVDRREGSQRRKEPEVEVRRPAKPAKKEADEYAGRELPDRWRNDDDAEEDRRRTQREEPRIKADARALALRPSYDDNSDGDSAVDAKSAVSTDKDQEEVKSRVRIVEPPKNEEAPAQIKSILRKPTEKFPDHHDGIREGVTPLEPEKKGIPKDAKWTKIDRRLVNPEALDLAQLRYEERMDYVIVLKVLTKEEIQALADKTAEIRGTFIRQFRRF